MLVLGLIAGLAWFVYSPALSGALLLDDISNLSGLGHVQDRLTALIFIFSGDAGPVGRPVALATFALQADAWGATAEPFLRVNILIHLINACLLAGVLWKLSGTGGIPGDKRHFVAIGAAAIWLFMPLLASSSLMIVQRMTTLSATFVLLALLGYLRARAGLDRSPGRALAGMSVCLLTGTLLAVLTKESGALLATYVLALESTVLPRPQVLARARWQTWKALFLLMPTVLILGYLLYRVPYPPDVILRRDFTAWERLLTESRILWEYLFNAFIPQPGHFGPFHDGYSAAGTILNPLTLLSVAAWLAVSALAVVWRRRYPLLGLAVFWYLGGHLLESTVLPLELYFEHRNYLPIVGPIYAACAALMQVAHGRERVVCVGICSYAGLSAVVLFTHATLWGNPAEAARYWKQHFPESVRAASTAAQYTLASQGLEDTLRELDRLAAVNPGAGYIRIPGLNLSCISAPGADHGQMVRQLKQALTEVDFSFTVATMLSELLTTATRARCNGVDADTVVMLATALLDNPSYGSSPKYVQLHHQLLARKLRLEGDFDAAIDHLQAAIAHRPSADLNMMMVTLLADARRFDAARAFIDAARENAPRHPFRRYVWLKRLGILSA